jgi:autotransporter-associated beta strand protein
LTSGSIASIGAGALDLLGDVTINGAFASISSGLNLGGVTRTFTGIGDLVISGPISGSGSAGLTKTGLGVLSISGGAANTYPGQTTVNSGSLHLAKTGVAAVPGNLVVSGGDAIEEADAQIADTSNVFVDAAGTLDLNGHGDSIGALTVLGSVTLGTGSLLPAGVSMTGGSISATGAGTLFLQSDVTTLAASASATISGNLDLGGVTRTFSMADGAAPIDLDLSAAILGASGAGVTKAGAGTLGMFGIAVNTYTGPTTANAGTLEFARSAPAVLGSLTINNGAVASEIADNQIADTSSVTVNAGGTFDVNNVADAIGGLTVFGSVNIGTGTLSAGPVQMTGGSIASTGTGKLKLLGDVTTSTASASATISGNLDLGGATRTFAVADGAAAIDLDLPATIGNGALTKSVLGKLRLEGTASNTYTGLTTVSAGALELDKSGGTLALLGDLQIVGGTAREIGNDQIADTATVTVNSNGAFDTSGSHDTIGPLNVGGGSVTIGSGVLTTGAVTMTGGSIGSTGAGKLLLQSNVRSFPASASAAISGTLDLGGATRMFAVADGAATPDLDIQGLLTNGGVTKTGAGAMRLSSAAPDTYTGPTTVTDGTLELAKTGGASAVPGDLTVTGGIVRELAANQIANSSTVTVNAGGTLNLNGQTDTVGVVSVAGGTVNTGGTLTSHGRLTSGNTSFDGAATLAMDLVDTANSDHIAVNGAVAVGGALQLIRSASIAIGTAISIIDNDGADPVTGTFTGLPQGASFFATGQLFSISYVGGTGNDVVVTRIAGPTVLSTQVNDGSAQRSSVTSLKVTFSAQVSFAGAVGSAFTLTRTGGGTINFAASASVVNGQTVVTLDAFTGSETEFGSLSDGRYTLTALASQISAGGQALDGNSDGTGGDNYTLDDTQGLFRLFGDVNGDQTVNGFDLGFFRNAFGTQIGDPNYLSYLDLNGDGVINGFDLGQFRTRFGTMLP